MLEIEIEIETIEIEKRIIFKSWPVTQILTVTYILSRDQQIMV
jgi:hypothetical protein